MSAVCEEQIFFFSRFLVYLDDYGKSACKNQVTLRNKHRNCLFLA